MKGLPQRIVPFAANVLALVPKPGTKVQWAPRDRAAASAWRSLDSNQAKSNAALRESAAALASAWEAAHGKFAACAARRFASHQQYASTMIGEDARKSWASIHSTELTAAQNSFKVISSYVLMCLCVNCFNILPVPIA